MINKEIELAFGEKGLGIILIEDIPNLKETRLELLKLIKKFAELPEEIKNKYSHPESNYSFGWSHGKEKMKDNIPDLAKGSYYANPINDIITKDINLKNKYPELYSDNIWPTNELPDLELYFKKMSDIQINIGYRMCKLFDVFLNEKTNNLHELNTIYNLISKSNTYKGRLLHYFSNKNNKGNLCGWHVDHGGITLLLSPMYFDQEKIINLIDNSCLFVKSFNNKNVKINIPENCIAIQTGEMIQYFSGGYIRATPHCVKSTLNNNFTREQFALFMDCSSEQKLIKPTYYKEDYDICYNLPEGVPKLKDRLKDTTTYKELVKKTVNCYY